MFLGTIGTRASLSIFGLIFPLTVLSQSHDDHGAHGHAHMGQTVSCENLAAPPWNGLPVKDKQQIESLRTELASLKTPEAAKAAGFFPALAISQVWECTT
jgi:hypothetical protein